MTASSGRDCLSRSSTNRRTSHTYLCITCADDTDRQLPRCAAESSVPWTLAPVMSGVRSPDERTYRDLTLTVELGSVSQFDSDGRFYRRMGVTGLEVSERGSAVSELTGRELQCGT